MSDVFTGVFVHRYRLLLCCYYMFCALTTAINIVTVGTAIMRSELYVSMN